MLAKGKEIYSDLRWTLTNRMSAKMKYFPINFLHFILNACQILSTFTNWWHCLDLHSRCLHLPHTHTHTPNIPVISLRIIISLIQCSEYTALLKTLHSHFWWDVLPCHYDPHSLNNTFISLVFKLTWTCEEDSKFSPQMVLRILNVCVQDFCVVSVVWSFWIHGCLYGF